MEEMKVEMEVGEEEVEMVLEEEEEAQVAMMRRIALRHQMT